MVLFEDPLVNMLILVVSLTVLDQASDRAVANSVKISDVAGYGKTTVGFILIAFFTSLPALCVSIIAALTARIDVAVGNALGSNIVNICLILGAILVFTALKRQQKTKHPESMTKEEMTSLYFGLFIGSAIPLALIYIGYASKVIGIVLLLIFILYTYQLLRPKNIQERLFFDAEPKQSLLKPAAFIALSAVIVVLASFFTVDSASSIATFLHIDPAVIGSTIVAFGTSTSVLFASIRAIRRGHADISLGNIVGTCFINTTLILGSTLIIWPLRVDMTIFSSLVVFSVMANLLLWYFLSSERIGWREGAILLLMYALFLIVTLGVYTP